MPQKTSIGRAVCSTARPKFNSRFHQHCHLIDNLRNILAASEHTDAAIGGDGVDGIVTEVSHYLSNTLPMLARVLEVVSTGSAGLNAIQHRRNLGIKVLGCTSADLLQAFKVAQVRSLVQHMPALVAGHIGGLLPPC